MISLSKELDLHGIKHEDVERLVENFILLNQMPMTIITGNSFNGWDFIISWLLNPKNKKRRLHGDFYGGKDNLKRYAEAWPEKQKWLIPKIENLFKAVDKKGHFTWDTAKRFQRKKNKIHD